MDDSNPNSGMNNKIMLTHAGSITFRQSVNEILYLVISSSDGAHWVFPKGHIEPNESPEETALRELREEAGIIGEIVDRLPIQSFEKPKEKVSVQYFLVKGLGSGQINERRIVRWEALDAALELLSFEEDKMVLRDGAGRVHSAGAGHE